jgi:hypothetical protein
MEEVFRMYAMSDGEAKAEPANPGSNHGDFEEDEEVETFSVLTSSDDDEVVTEETVVVFLEKPASKPAAKKAAKKEAPQTAAAKRLRLWQPRSRKFRQRRLRPRKL